MMFETYTFCRLLPSNYHSDYYCITDFPVSPGDYVVIPIYPNFDERVALVLDVFTCTANAAPRPPKDTSHLLRHYGPDEPPVLQRQKQKLVPEKAIRFPSPALSERLAVKHALSLNGVNSDKIRAGKKLLQELTAREMGEDEVPAEGYAPEMTFSADGKTLLRFHPPKSSGPVIVCIPDGVEEIADKAFLHVEIASIQLPKSLKSIGKYTLHHPSSAPQRDRYAKDISSIHVQAGNPSYFADNVGFYTMEAGKKQLCILLDRSLEEYVAPDDVVSYAVGAFDGCFNLKRLTLSASTEFFNEYALPSNSMVEEIMIPSGVKQLTPKRRIGGYAQWNRANDRIDESNPYLFVDEDSIYEVLDDGTYKLLTNRYTGKGRVLILDETSEIGAYAFQGQKYITAVPSPRALRVIGRAAFHKSGLKEAVIPEGVVRIEALAFCGCEDLQSVRIPASVEYIAENAFAQCHKLDRFVTEGDPDAFVLKQGKVVKKAPDPIDESGTTPYARLGDPFAKFVQVLIAEVERDSIREKSHADDFAFFDEEKRSITVSTIFTQKCESPELLAERVACAETLAPNSPIRIRSRDEIWEAVSENGKSLGEISRGYQRLGVCYQQYFTLGRAFITSITPRSKRGASAKFALGTLQFEILERELPEDLTRQDYETMQRFSYVAGVSEIRALRWIGGNDIRQVTLPTGIEGKPVRSLGNVFQIDPLYEQTDNAIAELVIPEGITHLEAGALCELWKIRKIVFPASVISISPDVFSGSDGGDYILWQDPLFVAPPGSCADTFLRLYKPKCHGMTALRVIHEDAAAPATDHSSNPNDRKE